ncbi:MAG: hypothetical protein ACHQF4_07420 [Sphingobacteriales bacterium]
MKQAKRLFPIIFFTLFTYCILPAFAQTKPIDANSQRKDFYLLLKEADLKFDFPKGFKEIGAINNDYFSFDFALKEPDHNCEVWLMVRSQKQNWMSYERNQSDKKVELANPDSMYIDIGKAYATELTGSKNFMVRNIPTDVLAEYNADVGKSYLLNLRDMPVIHHYQYALIISLQKNHIGTFIAIFFTNYKDPDFYGDVNRVSHSFKFIP